MEDKYGQHLTIMSDGKLYAEIVSFCLQTPKNLSSKAGK